MSVRKMSKIQQRLVGIPNIVNRFVSNTVDKTKILNKAIADKEAWENPHRVIFMSRDQVKQHEFNAHDDALISISDTGVCSPALASSPKDMLAVDFHDYVDREGESVGHHWITHEQAKLIGEFVEKNKTVRNIIVHCNYGQSRSKAVAMAIKNTTNRSIFRANGVGAIHPYSANDDVGNHRVYSLVSDMIIHCSEELPT